MLGKPDDANTSVQGTAAGAPGPGAAAGIARACESAAVQRAAPPGAWSATAWRRQAMAASTAAGRKVSRRQYMATEPKPDRRKGTMRIAFICEKRRAARCEATPIMSLLLISVRFTVTEFDSTASAGADRPTASSAVSSALRMGVPLGQRIQR